MCNTRKPLIPIERPSNFDVIIARIDTDPVEVEIRRTTRAELRPPPKPIKHDRFLPKGIYADELTRVFIYGQPEEHYPNGIQGELLPNDEVVDDAYTRHFQRLRFSLGYKVGGDATANERARAKAAAEAEARALEAVRQYVTACRELDSRKPAA